MDLYNAAASGDVERVQALLEQGVDKDITVGVDGRSPLFVASMNGHLAVVSCLVSKELTRNRLILGDKLPSSLLLARVTWRWCATF